MVEWHRGGGEGEGEQHYLVSYQLESKVWNGGRLATRNVEITLHSCLLYVWLPLLFSIKINNKKIKKSSIAER